jgi:hypothetical protein
MRRAEVHQKSVSRTPISPDGAGLRRPIRADGNVMEGRECAGRRGYGRRAHSAGEVHQNSLRDFLRGRALRQALAAV